MGKRKCLKCDGLGLPTMSHRDGGMCYQCGALPAYRVDNATEPRPLTYSEAVTKYGRVVEVLTHQARGYHPESQGRMFAWSAIDLIRSGDMTDTHNMWEHVRKAKAAKGRRNPNLP